MRNEERRFRNEDFKGVLIIPSLKLTFAVDLKQDGYRYC
jgi:hypothetical protein